MSSIAISSQMENPAANQAVGESPQAAGVFAGRKGKREGAGLGVFAKILAGLSKNLTGKGAAADASAGEAVNGTGKAGKKKAGGAEALVRVPSKDKAGAKAGKKSAAGEAGSAEALAAALAMQGRLTEKTSFFTRDKLTVEDAALTAAGTRAAKGKGGKGTDGLEKPGGGKAADAAPHKALNGETLAGTLDAAASLAADTAQALEKPAKKHAGKTAADTGGELFSGAMKPDADTTEKAENNASRLAAAEKTGATDHIRDTKNAKRAAKGRGAKESDQNHHKEEQFGLADASKGQIGVENLHPEVHEAEIRVEIRADGQHNIHNPQNSANQEAVSGWEGHSAQALTDMLARELHQNLNGDIVRQAHVTLREGGAGTIKLSLHPEELGNVKVRLEMSENKITGHIVVETEEAYRAFEQEIQSLEQAFMESGYEGANLSMSMAEQGRGETGEDAFLPRFAAPGWDTGIDSASAYADTGAFSMFMPETQVNVLA